MWMEGKGGRREGERGQREWEGGEGRERRKGVEWEERGYSPQTSIPGAATESWPTEIFVSDLSVNTGRSLSSACYRDVAMGWPGWPKPPQSL